MNLVLAVTGATGIHAAGLLIEKSPWPVTLVASDWGKDVCRREYGEFEELARGAAQVYDNANQAAPIASGSVATAGMVVLPCTSNTLAHLANGLGDTLILRAAHCHLKERRKLVLCVRESPWTLMDLKNAVTVASAGGIIMPLSPPFYIVGGRSPESVTMKELIEIYVDRVLAVLGHAAERNWETVS